jgi:hypothetical protein
MEVGLWREATGRRRESRCGGAAGGNSRMLDDALGG